VTLSCSSSSRGNYRGTKGNYRDTKGNTRCP